MSAALHLHELRISNCLRIEGQLTIAPHGNHAVISGPNGSGKSSTVDALWAALGGLSQKDRPELVHRGAAEAKVELDLGEYVVSRTWPADGQPRLVVKAKDGSTIRRPQELLDSLLSRYSFDLVAFLDQRPQDQVDTVLALGGVVPPIDKVAEITGEEHPANPGESAEQYLMRLSADETGLYYVRRRSAGREVDQKRESLKETSEQLAGLGADGLDLTPASGILAEIEKLNRQADERRGVAAELEAGRRDLQLVLDKSKRIGTEATTLEGQIAQLEQQLAEKRKVLEETRGQVPGLEQKAKELGTWVEEATADLAAMPDPSGRIQELRQKLTAAEANQKTAARAELLRDNVARLGSELKAAEAHHAGLDDQLDALRDLRLHLLDGLDLGVEGLTVGHGELRLGGVTFRQASSAQQIRVACAIAMKQTPRLKLLRIDGGERLDAATWEELRKQADAHGWQIIATKVSDADRLSVEIIDSREPGDDPVEPAHSEPVATQAAKPKARRSLGGPTGTASGAKPEG